MMDRADIITLKFFRKVCFFILITPLTSDLKYPENNQTIFSTHIFFQWNQVPNVIYYNLIAYNSDSSSAINIIDSTLLFVDQNTFFWGDTVTWKVKGYDSSGVSIYGSEINQFQIGSKKFNGVELLNLDTINMNGGITFFGIWDDWSSGAIDENGNEIWNDGNMKVMICHIDEYGQIFGSQDYPLDNVPNRGIEFNIKHEILWQEPLDTRLDPHDLKRLPDGNLVGLKAISEFGPIPIGPWQEHYQNLGYLADGETDEVNWVGQKIIIFNHLSNNIEWEWNPFDYYSIDDYDNHLGTWWNLGWGYDWLHSNSIFFDDNNHEIYYSNRHISRVSKISYPDGNLIWMTGLPEPYMANGDNHLCNDLLFSFQHDVKLLSNGNIMLYDNGNLSPQLFNTNIPRSRILEISINSENSCSLIWEYELPQHLYAVGMGSTQILNNGNIQITSGNQCGTILEINRLGEIIWQVQLGLDECQNSLYKAFRVKSLYPNIYSVIIDNYIHINVDQNQKGIVLKNNNDFGFRIFNESSENLSISYFLSKIGDEQEIIISDTIQLNLPTNQESHQNIYFDNLEIGIHQVALNIKTAPFYKIPDRVPFFLKIEENLGISSDKERKIDFRNNFPNPFNPITTLSYNLSEDAFVNITIYDMLGNIVKNLVNKHENSGYKSVQWNATNNQGQSVSAGVYLYTIQAGNFRQTKKMVLLK